jgi:coenzyme PQQ biosynthesis protein PqqD
MLSGEAREGAPKLAQKARLREGRKNGEAFLLYPERGLRLNATAAEIARLCDGMNSQAEIARILSHRTGAEEAEAKIEVERFLKALADRGLLEKGRR